MGLFNFLKKKDDNGGDKEKDVMLTLNERQAPVKRGTVPPRPATIPPAAQPQDRIPRSDGEEDEETKKRLETKSIAKKAETLPSVKKLVIPAQDALETVSAPTDDNVVEVVKMKQVDLSSEPAMEAQPSFIPGEFIDIPVSVFLEHIPKEHLKSNIDSLFDTSTKVRFTKDLILPILAQGVFAVVGSAFLARLPEGLAIEDHASVQEIYNIPLTGILPLVPPDWFMISGQDESKERMISEMNNPFESLDSGPKDIVLAPEEEDESELSVAVDESDEFDPQQTVKTSTPTQSTTPSQPPQTPAAAPSLFADEEARPETVQKQTPTEAVFDAQETIQRQAPNNTPAFDAQETIQRQVPNNTPAFDAQETIQRQAPAKTEAPVFDAQETIQRQAPAKTEAGNTDTVIEHDKLCVPFGKIASFFNMDLFYSEPDSTVVIRIPKSKVVSCLAEGAFLLTMAEVNTYSGQTLSGSEHAEVSVTVGLGPVFDIIPPEWFSIQYEDTSKIDMMEDMNDIFDDSSFNSKPDTDETETVIEEEQVSPVIEEDEEEEIAAVIEEEVAPPIIEEDEEDGPDLITGGAFGKLSLFDEEDEDEEEIAAVIEEEVAPPVIEEEEIAAVIEEEIAAVIEEEEIAAVIEEEVAPPVIEEEEIAAVIEVAPPVIEEEEIAAVIEEEVAPPVIEEEEIAAVIEDIEPPVAASAPVSAAREKTPSLPSAFDIRPTSENVAKFTDKSSVRPSTAPNGIDINRCTVADICRLHSAGEKLAKAIIDYRAENGDFTSVNELKQVPGVGTSVYRSLTGLRPNADLVAAERKINKLVGLSQEKDFSLNKIITCAQEKYKFKSIILSGKDGFKICSSGDKALLESNSELLAASTPQLFKKTRHFLKQSNLPHPETFTFYLEGTPVTFGIADEVFMVMVHNSSFPDAKHMKQCKELINQLAWFCCYRAVV